MSKMYRLNFCKNEEIMGPGVGYHPYFDGSRDARQTTGQSWPFDATLDVLVAGNQTRQGRCFERRNRAATLEKQRQSRINDAIHRLRQVLPDNYVHGERMTKAKTLRFAAAYIQELTSVLQSNVSPDPGTPTNCRFASPPIYAAEDMYPHFSPMPFMPHDIQRLQTPSCAMNVPQMSPYGAPHTGPFSYYQGPPSVPGTSPGATLRPLCASSPTYHRGPSFAYTPPPVTSPSMTSYYVNYPEAPMTEQYFAYIPRWNPHPASPMSPHPSHGSQVTVPSPQPTESDVITVDASDDENF